jgi:hypothetical protein
MSTMRTPIPALANNANGAGLTKAQEHRAAAQSTLDEIVAGIPLRRFFQSQHAA